ncbi:MAG: MFS transporter [Bacteroidetes bacterium]|nr:MFS transporter [Bacteroidota bacterium]
MNLPNPWGGLRGLPRELWILFAVTAINRSGMMALPFLALYLTESLHFSPADAGLALSCYGLGSMISSPFAGRLSDRLGPSFMMKASLLSSGLVLLLFPFLRDLLSIILLTAVWSICSEAFRPASLVVVSDYTELQNRKAGFALNRLGINLGMSIGPTLGGFLVMISYPAIFFVNGVVSLIAGAVLIMHPMRPVVHETDTSRAGVGMLRALKDRRLVYIMAALIPIMLVFFQNDAAMPLYLVREVGIRESTFGMLFLINTGIILLLEVPLNISMSHWKNGSAMALGALLIGAGYGAFAAAHGLPVVILAFVIWTFGEMILFPTSASYLADIAPADRRGVYMGFYNLTFSISFALGPWLGTLVYETWGGVILWIGTFFVGCLAALMMRRAKDS